MPNYLERVASSGARRAAIAKPPVSGPPVLPAGRDFSMAAADPFVSDEDQFLETLETSAPARTEELAPKPEVRKTTGVSQDTTSVAPPEPKPRPGPSHERLSSDSPFTVQVPRTLRPISSANAPTPAEAPRERTRVRAATTVGPEEFTINREPTPVVHSANSDATETDSATAEMHAPVRPPVADPAQAAVRGSVHTEASLPDVAPVPRVDPTPRYSAEPTPPPASPVHLPQATGNATRQEQSRVHIGSLEVLVNNHPQVTTVRPAPPPPRSESLNLEKRYLDRFRLRH